MSDGWERYNEGGFCIDGCGAYYDNAAAERKEHADSCKYSNLPHEVS